MGDRIEDRLDGKIYTFKDETHEGNYYRLKKDIREVDSGKIGRYIERVLPAWQKGELHNTQFLAPELLKHVYFQPEETLFIDTETLGLAYKHPIFLISMAYVEKNNVMSDILLARNPLEEETMLRAFDDFAANFKYLVSYNGSRFDNRRLTVRNRAYLIDWEWPDERHLDLYQFIRAFFKKHLKEKKPPNLKGVEEVLFGQIRDADLPSAEVPKAYNEYIYEGNPDRLIKAIRHTDIDVISLVAIYLRILQDPKFIPRIKEFKKRKKWKRRNEILIAA